MKYNKLPLTYKQQASQLIDDRGLIANHEHLVKCLKAVNYYRLSGYWYPFLNPDNKFKANTTFNEVWNRYLFDRELRLLMLDAIEQIEVAVRTGIVYEFAHFNGAFGYLENKNLPNLKNSKFIRFIKKVDTEAKHSKETFVKHFNEKYGDIHGKLPLWMVAEIMSFGMMLTMFRGVDDSIKKRVALNYGVPDVVLESWLKSLNVIRNICAHHGRLWNRELGYKPRIPRKKKHSQWHTPVSIENNRIFSILTICNYMMKESKIDSGWQEKIIHFLKSNKNIPLKTMGVPQNWQEHLIWK